MAGKRASVRFTVNKKNKHWSTVGLLFTEASRYARDGADRLMEEQAERFVKEVQTIILSQDPHPASWPPLSQHYLQRKMREGRDPRILISSGFFVSHLETRRVKAGKGEIRWFAGASPYVQHEPSGLTMKDIAHVFEYGRRSLGIPPRPIFAPARQRLIPQFRAEWSAWWRKMRLRA